MDQTELLKKAKLQKKIAAAKNYSRAMMLMSQGRTDEAKVAIMRAMRDEPGNKTYSTFFGKISLGSGRYAGGSGTSETTYEATVKEHKSASAANPNDFDADLNLILIYLQYEKYSKAIKRVKELKKRARAMKAKGELLPKKILENPCKLNMELIAIYMKRATAGMENGRMNIIKDSYKKANELCEKSIALARKKHGKKYKTWRGEKKYDLTKIIEENEADLKEIEETCESLRISL